MHVYKVLPKAAGVCHLLSLAAMTISKLIEPSEPGIIYPLLQGQEWRKKILHEWEGILSIRLCCGRVSEGFFFFF